MALSLSRRSGRFFLGSSRVVCSSSFQSLVCKHMYTKIKTNQYMTYSKHLVHMLLCKLFPPVQVCAPHNQDGKCRHLQLAHSPWRGPPAELSSCTLGKAWLSSQTDVSGPCRREIIFNFQYHCHVKLRPCRKGLMNTNIKNTASLLYF